MEVSSLTPDRLPHDVLSIHCTCCDLPQRLRDRDGAIPTICDTCVQHQGTPLDKRLQRAEAHEEMLHARLAACRASEQRATGRAEKYNERLTAALSSRGSLARRLVWATGQAGTHRCDATRIGDDPQVVAWAEQDQRIRADRFDDDDL